MQNKNIFIGKFRILHKGHQKTIEEIRKSAKDEDIIIFLSSSNILSLEERQKRKIAFNTLYPNIKTVEILDLDLEYNKTKLMTNKQKKDWVKYINVIFKGFKLDKPVIWFAADGDNDWHYDLNGTKKELERLEDVSTTYLLSIDHNKRKEYIDSKIQYLWEEN